MDGVSVRFARPQDREDVLAISATVWEGHDYIPEVWSRWLAERPDEGFLIVAEESGKVIGIQHTAIQPGQIGWMEGIRVHPENRGRGLAKLMLNRGLEIATERGCRRARLSTANENQASQSVAQRNGFGEIGRFYRFSAPAGGGPEVVVSNTVEAGALAQVRSLLHDESTLLADGWTALDVPGQKEVSDFELGLMDVEGHGVALAGATPNRDRVSIAYIGGPVDAVRRLGLALRREAADRGLESAGGMLRRHPDVEAGLQAAGYEMRDDLSMVVFERGL